MNWLSVSLVNFTLVNDRVLLGLSRAARSTIYVVQVASLMFGQLHLLFEALPAVSAGEGFLARVDAQVVFQVATLVKFPLADTTDQEGIQAVCIIVHYLPLNA